MPRIGAVTGASTADDSELFGGVDTDDARLVAVEVVVAGDRLPERAFRLLGVDVPDGRFGIGVEVERRQQLVPDGRIDAVGSHAVDGDVLRGPFEIRVSADELGV